jgi:hypothetical protein
MDDRFIIMDFIIINVNKMYVKGQL